MPPCTQTRAHRHTLLTRIAIGAPSVVVSVLHPPDVARQLAHLGVVPGAVVLVRRIASFGGPLFLEIQGAAILLARTLARRIEVTELP